ncbi:MAG: tetratricopeptide repeat protein, partial [Bacteroidota bacterium]
MKKLKILLLALLYVGTVHAQKSKVQAAVNYLKYDELDKAKTNIDEAASNVQSKDMEKTWYYRGLIYRQIYKHEKFGSLDAQPLQKAFDYLDKSLELNQKSEYAEDIGKRKIEIANKIFGEGVEQFNAKNYTAALEAFEYVLKYNENDTLTTLNAAYSAERSGNNEKAKQYYNKLIEMKYNEPKIYVFLSKIYQSEKDTVKGLAIIQAGRQKFPGDDALAIEETNYFLASGKSREALDPLNIAINKDDKKPELYFARGSIYDKLGDTGKAKADYQKSIDLKPDYFDAYYNLGAMYFNEAADLANKANNIAPGKQKEYDEAKAKAEAKFREAEPFLEKAYKLNPKDKSTLTSLKQIYVRIGKLAKAEEIKKALDDQNYSPNISTDENAINYNVIHATTTGRTIEVPIITRGNTNVIPIKINGLSDIDFVFDTGASETTVTAHASAMDFRRHF